MLIASIRLNLLKSYNPDNLVDSEIVMRVGKRSYFALGKNILVIFSLNIPRAPVFQSTDLQFVRHDGFCIRDAYLVVSRKNPTKLANFKPLRSTVHTAGTILISVGKISRVSVFPEYAFHGFKCCPSCTSAIPIKQVNIFHPPRAPIFVHKQPYRVSECSLCAHNSYV